MAVSGQVTFTQPGIVDIDFGIPTHTLDVLADGLGSWGHADPSNQFCHTIGKTKSMTSCIVIYNTSGVKMIEAKVVSGWGNTILRFNVTTFTPGWPWDAIVT